MVNDPLALATPPDAPSEDEYQAFVAALSESARGRAFLAEHARRSRNEDSATLLSSVQRLEGLVRAQVDAPPAENPIDDVRGMLESIRAAQADIDLGTLTAQVAKLAELIEGVQQRIETLATPPAPPQEEPPIEPVAETAVAEEEVAFAAPVEEPAELPEAELPETETVEDITAEPAADVEAMAVHAEAEAEVESAVEAETETAPVLEDAFELPAEPSFDIAPEASAELEAAEPVMSEAPAAEADTMAEPESLLAPLEFMPAAEAADETLPETDAPSAFDEDAAMPEVAWGNEAVSKAEAAEEETVSAAPSPPPGLAISALVETLAAAEVEARSDAPVPEATVIKAGSIPPPQPYTGEDFSTGKSEDAPIARRGRAVPPPVDPLADIKALSEEERLALFT